MSVQEISSALPVELLYRVPSKLEESKTVSYSVNSQSSSYSQPGSDIRFTMPMVQKQFLKTNSVAVSGQLVITVSNAAVIGVIQGTLYSVFQNQQLQLANGVVLETFNNPGICVNIMLNQTADVSQQNALALSYGIGTDANSNCTLLIGTAADNINGWIKSGLTTTIDFCIPLISALTSSQSVPMFVSDMTLIMTLGNVLGNIVKTAGGVETFNTATLQNLRLNYDCMELSNSAFMDWLSFFPDQRFLLKNTSYTYTNYTIQPNQSGTIDMPLNFNLASGKQLFISFKSDNIDGDFGSFNPNLDSVQFITGTGEMYPTRPIDCKNGPLVWYYLQKGWNSFYSKDTNGLISRKTFLKRAAVANGYAAYSGGGADITTNGNKFFLCIDLEKLSQNSDLVYNGARISLNSFVRLQISAGFANAITAHMFVSYDQFWSYDLVNNMIQVIA